MNKQEAYHILGVRPEDPFQEIRRRYHLLMHVCHPDATGEQDPGSLEEAQRVTEAFRYLKKHLPVQEINAQNWGLQENPDAFCRRRIYLEEDLYGDGILVDTGIFGKFYWDPDLETFPLFLKSVGEAARILSEERQRPVSAKLLHLLIQEYIKPWECLQLFGRTQQTDPQEWECLLKCHLKPAMSMRELTREWNRTGSANADPGNADPENVAETTGISVSVKDSRLLAHTQDKTLGQITFEDNCLYYLVTPLLLQGAARASLTLKAPRPVIRAELKLQVRPERTFDPTRQLNREIIKTLKGNSI